MDAWMVDPACFEVAYAINPHMTANVGRVDRALARRQWDELARVYRRLGVRIGVVPARVGLPDAVFAANSATAVAPGVAVRSHMANAERQPEVAHVADWLAGQGWRVLPAPPEPLEGQGDLRALPGERRWLGGHGFRSTPAALAWFARATGDEVIPLRLVDPNLYHLDTALLPLAPGAAAWVPEAFDREARAKIAAIFPTLVRIPYAEAVGALAANGIVWGRAVVLDAAAAHTRRLLADRFEVIPIETTEFRRSGGSVFCLTQQVRSVARPGRNG